MLKATKADFANSTLVPQSSLGFPGNTGRPRPFCQRGASMRLLAWLLAETLPPPPQPGYAQVPKGPSLTWEEAGNGSQGHEGEGYPAKLYWNLQHICGKCMLREIYVRSSTFLHQNINYTLVTSFTFFSLYPGVGILHKILETYTKTSSNIHVKVKFN